MGDLITTPFFIPSCRLTTHFYIHLLITSWLSFAAKYIRIIFIRCLKENICIDSYMFTCEVSGFRKPMFFRVTTNLSERHYKYIFFIFRWCVQKFLNITCWYIETRPGEPITVLFIITNIVTPVTLLHNCTLQLWNHTLYTFDMSSETKLHYSTALVLYH